MASEGEGYGGRGGKRSERRITRIGRLSGGSFKGKFGSGSASSSSSVATTAYPTQISSQAVSTVSSAYPPRISLTSSSGAYSNLSADNVGGENTQPTSTSLSRHLSLSQKRLRSPRTSNTSHSFLSSNNGTSDTSGASSARSSANASPRSSLTNKIGDYASRYLDTIRPKWGGSSSATATARTSPANRSTSSSRSESPLNPPLGSSSYMSSAVAGGGGHPTSSLGSKTSMSLSSATSSTIPHLLTFRQRERLSPSASYVPPLPSAAPHTLSDSSQKRSFSPTSKPYSTPSGSDR